MAIEIGQLCVKTAGRDAGRECLIVERLDNNFVLVDGNTRRKKCNIDHLQILNKQAKLKAKASHEEVAAALKELGVEIVERAPAREKKEAKAEPKEVKKKPAKKKK